MSNLLIATIVIFALLGLAFAFAPREEIVTEIQIDAPPSAVWSVLTDGDAYGDWNPFIVSMRGRITEGATLENTMRPRSGSQMTFRPTVLRADSPEEFRWLGRVYVPRILDGEHYLLLTANEGGTRLVHGELFHGIVLWFMDVEQFKADFERMNEALKNRVEELDS